MKFGSLTRAMNATNCTCVRPCLLTRLGMPHTVLTVHASACCRWWSSCIKYSLLLYEFQVMCYSGKSRALPMGCRALGYYFCLRQCSPVFGMEVHNTLVLIYSIEISD